MGQDLRLYDVNDSPNDTAADKLGENVPDEWEGLGRWDEGPWAILSKAAPWSLSGM